MKNALAKATTASLGFITGEKSDVYSTSSTENTVMVLKSNPDENEYLLIPSINGEFSTSVHIKETDESLYVTPYDLFKDSDEEKPLSLIDIFNDEVSLDDEAILGKEKFKYRFDSNDKQILNNLFSSDEMDDAIGKITDVLEEHPYRPFFTGKEYKTVPTSPQQLLQLISYASSIQFNVLDYLIEATEKNFEDVFLAFDAGNERMLDQLFFDEDVED